MRLKTVLCRYRLLVLPEDSLGYALPGLFQAGREDHCCRGGRTPGVHPSPRPEPKDECIPIDPGWDWVPETARHVG